MPATIRSVIYSVGLKHHGGEKVWNIVWDRYKNASNVHEKHYLLEALAQSTDLWLIQRYEQYIESKCYHVLGTHQKISSGWDLSGFNK